MGISPVFSEDFYTKSLFQKGERVCLTDSNSLIVLPRESRWSRLCRFMTFQQDPGIHQVHERLRVLMEQIQDPSTSTFSTLKDEVHSHGERDFNCLTSNLDVLREKLDRVGQLNVFSSLILRIINVFRSIFHQSPIELKTYANVSFEYEEIPWAGNYSSWRGLSRYVESSFPIRMGILEKEALQLTEEDKESCLFSAESSDPIINEHLQKLEKGLEIRWLLKQTHKDFHPPQMGLQQVSVNAAIHFDAEKQQFLLTISNPRGSQSLPQSLKNYLSGLNVEEKSIHYVIEEGNERRDISWACDGEPVSMALLPNVTYKIYIGSELLKESFLIKQN